LHRVPASYRSPGFASVGARKLLSTIAAQKSAAF
jgi:hypothetical protein